MKTNNKFDSIKVFQHGFTLIEIILVLIVLSVIAVVAMPKTGLLDGYNEIGFRDKLVSSIEFARKTAVASRRNVKISANNSGLTFTIDNDTPEGDASPSTLLTFPNALNLPVIDKNCSGVVNKICVSPNISISTYPLSLVFSPLGQATALSYDYIITGESTITVHINSETGYVYY